MKRLKNWRRWCRLRPFAHGFKFTLKNDGFGDILEGNQGAHVFNAVAILNNEKPALTKLAKAGALKELEFSSMEYHYAEKKGEIRVGGDEKALKTLSGVIRGLAIEVTRSAELGIELRHYTYELGERFIETAKRFETRLSVIKARKDKIKTIKLNGYRSSYYNGSGELTIGGEDTMEDLDKILQEIK